MSELINIPPIFKVEQDIIDYSSQLIQEDLGKWAIVFLDGTIKVFETKRDAEKFVDSIFEVD